jgi:3'(2'), 5'-bisphosphate nucleotidase
MGIMNDDAMRPAINAVAAACRVARSVQQDLARVQQITKDDRSPVTVADFAVQAIVTLALKDAMHRVLIVGEEHAVALRRPEHRSVRQAVVEAVRLVRPDVGDDAVLDAIDACDHDATADSYWTLDPIDGTKGFLRGQQYAIALGRIDAGRVVLGVMGCPNLSMDWQRGFDDPDPTGVMYAAGRGSGCWQWTADDPGGDPQPVVAPRADSTFEPGATVRICESVESAHSRHTDSQRVSSHLGLSVDYARLDSQCKYSVVARGQADAYLRMPSRKAYVEKIWDHAAGSLIAEEAGAVVTDIMGTPLDFGQGRCLEANRGVVCAAGGAHPMIIRAIEELGIGAAV